MKPLILTILLITIQLTLAQIPPLQAQITINEIELNPEGKDASYEWIELFTTEPLDLTNYILKNNDNQTIKLNQSITDYLIITFNKQWLDNSDEKIYLINNNTILHETPILKDSQNNNKTLQNCNNQYLFKQQTKNTKNNCNKIQPETTATPKQTSPQQNQTPQPTNQTPMQEPIPQQQPSNLIQLTTPKTYNPQSEDIKTQNNIIYQSKNELIKQYSVYGFAILCAILCVLLAFNKLN
jgi:hypothetical protein